MSVVYKITYPNGTVTWPSSAATECASWMRELLK